MEQLNQIKTKVSRTKKRLAREEIEVQENHEPGVVLNDLQLEEMDNAFKNGIIKLDLLPNPTLYLFAKLLYYTGARPAAVLSLQVQHCDFTLSRIHLKAMKMARLKLIYNQQINWILVMKYKLKLILPLQVKILKKPF